MANIGDRELAELIELRTGRRRGLTGTLKKMDYALSSFLGPLPNKHFEKALFIGVGHGHDALLALARGYVGHVVGVDPYIEADGNGEEDYRQLMETISSHDLDDRFVVYHTTIQEYLRDNEKQFDLIIAADVLHHIFLTPQRLVDSKLFAEAKALFAALKKTAPDGCLAIAELQKNGLRPWLSRSGLLGGNVHYATKQQPRQWDMAVCAAGWRRLGMKNYVPYDLREAEILFNGWTGRWTVCDRYFLYYRNYTSN